MVMSCQEVSANGTAQRKPPRPVPIDGDAEGLLDGLGLLLGDDEVLDDGLPDGLLLGVLDGLGLLDTLDDGDALGVLDGLGLADTLDDGDALGVPLGLADGLLLGELDGIPSPPPIAPVINSIGIPPVSTPR